MNPAMPWIEHLMQDEGLSYRDARRMLDGYEAIPYVEDGEHKATLIKKNAEVHFAFFKKYRGKGVVTRTRLKAFFKPILDKEGFLTTKLAEGEPDSFIKRLGFSEIGKTASHRIFIINSIAPLEKRT